MEPQLVFFCFYKGLLIPVEIVFSVFTLEGDIKATLHAEVQHFLKVVHFSLELLWS